jgi:pimeloyl-ACP methyl ester carboxylesterase
MKIRRSLYRSAPGAHSLAVAILTPVTLPHDDVGAGPALVLVHAGVADRTMWSEHLEPLADAGFRVVAVDLPGFGEAPVPAVEDAPWVDVIETMDALGIEQAHLLGNSFGGAVVQRVAVVAPQRVLRLALISVPAPGIEPSHELAAVWEAEEAALEAGDIEAAVRAVVDAWTLPDAPAELRERLAAMQRRALELQADGSAPEAADPIGEDPGPLRRVTAPALIAAGEHDMSDFRLAAESLARTLPNAQLTTIEGAGHLAPLEQPVAFRERLLSFLG